MVGLLRATYNLCPQTRSKIHAHAIEVGFGSATSIDLYENSYESARIALST